MKKKIILSSILTIALCLSLIAGSTYALFTSESSVNIAATAGKVNVTATLDTLQVYSLGVEQSVNTDDKTFENGGTAELTDGKLTLTNITPGDKATLNITLTNNSNVNIQYRVKWTVNGDLANGLVATADGVDLADAAWTEWNIPTSDAEKVKVIAVSVELPITAGNEYQEAEADILFTVEAVQGNATPVSNPAELADALANAQPGVIELAAGDFGTVTLDGELDGVTLVFAENTDVKFNVVSGAVLKNVTIKNLVETSNDNSSAYVNGGVINIKAGATIENLVIEDTDFSGGSGGRSSALTVTEPTAEITFKNCKFGGTKYAVYSDSTPISELTFDQCSFENLDSWAILLNGSDTVGAKLTINNCTFENCTDGIAKYLGSTQPDGAFTVFTNNTLTNCQGHDGKEAEWFTIPGATSTITVSGNTLDSAAWTPGTAQGLGK